MKLPAQFGGAYNGFRAYWAAYGGWRASVGSPYFVAAIILTGLTAPLWLQENWWDLVLSVMPNVLGFSLGGFAIFLAFGDDGFRNLIGGKHPDDGPNEHSPYVEFSAAFLHFIVVQIAAILFSLCAKSFFAIKLSPDFPLLRWNELVKPVWWGLGFATFCYALMSALAAAMAVFGLTRSFDDYLSDKPDPNDKQKK